MRQKLWKKNPILLPIILSLVSYLSITYKVNAEVQPIQIEIKVESVSLDNALQSVVNQFGKQIVFFSDVPQGIVTNEFSGEYTEQGALNRLLKQTDLTYRYINETTIAIEMRNNITLYNKDENINKNGNVGEVKLETIVVTARKTVENLQEVPISVGIVDSDALNSMFDGGEDVRALAARIPSVYVEGSSGRTAPRFYIRGLGNVDFDLTSSQPVSIVMDDVVMENVLLKGFPLFDVEQVEILRGPQGTLFGRNTPAGIIKFSTRKPTDDIEANFSTSFGRYGSQIHSGAISGALSDTVSVRVSGQYNKRDDWIDNANNNKGDELGGHKELSTRAHILYKPSDDFEVLLTLQSRDLTGTTSIFRANILDKGSNQLNSSFDRDTVYYDGGRNNPSEVKTFGTILNLSYDFGDYTLTSITSKHNGSSNGRSDVDGGAGVGDTVNSGFIPFRSETGTLDSDLDQFTQELRLSSNNFETLNWQLGTFYFKDEFMLDSAAWDGIGGIDPIIRAITTQKSNSWAIFGQINYKLTDKLTITSGLRYSDDEKSFKGSRPIGYLGSIDARENIVDSHLSWDLSASYHISNDVMLYVRAANAYRGPSIQGKLLYSNNVTTAKSETVNSIDLGFKSQLLGDRLRLNAALYYYRVDDQQFTAIGGESNLNQLVNADKGIGNGFEIDATYLLTENLLLNMGFSYNHTEIKDKNLGVAPCGGGCTVTDPVEVIDGKDIALIDGNPFPQAPEWIYSLSGSYILPINDNGEFFIFSDFSAQGKTNFMLYESKEFNSNRNLSIGLRTGYRDLELGLEGAVFVRNLTDEENLVGGIDFNNLTGFVNDSRIWGVEFSYDFW
ncbi:MAG: TonB-dependent receptor [Colwellia sp.]